MGWRHRGGTSNFATLVTHVSGLTLAGGSGFTNGLARLLPGPYRVPTAFFIPQFVPLILMIFWMIRVRFKV